MVLGGSFLKSTVTPTMALTWCRRHSSPITIANKGQKNEKYNKNNRFVRHCSIETCPVSSTPRRSPNYDVRE